MFLGICNLLAGIPMVLFQVYAILRCCEMEDEKNKKKVGGMLACAFAILYVGVFAAQGVDTIISIWGIRALLELVVVLAATKLLTQKKPWIPTGIKAWIVIEGLHLSAKILVVILEMNMSSIQKPFVDDMLGQIVFYYYLFLSNPAGLTDEIIGMTTICSVVVLFVHGATLELMGRIVENQKSQNEMERKMMEKKYEYDYYLLAEEQAEAMQKIRQDMREQLKAVQQLMEGEDGTREAAESMLEKLEEEVSQIGRVYYCEDAVLNTVLSLKQEKARKLGIEMNIKVDSTVKTEAEDIDLCCIVTNLLDNAIESTERVRELYPDKTEQGIEVHVGHRGGYLAMKVDNPAITVPVKKKKGGYLSTKKEEGKWKDNHQRIRQGNYHYYSSCNSVM